MSGRPFVDTNVLLYLLSADAGKAARAEAVLAERIVISVQVLNEFANVARRKLGLAWPAQRLVLSDLRHFADVHPLTLATHERAMGLAERHQFSVYDALIVAAALEAGCQTLWTEDLQHGQVVDERLTLRNPFL